MVLTWRWEIIPNEIPLYHLLFRIATFYFHLDSHMTKYSINVKSTNKSENVISSVSHEDLSPSQFHITNFHLFCLGNSVSCSRG